MPKLTRRFELDLLGGINLDATSDQGSGAEGRAAYLGTVGKVLLSALVLGRPAHACYPFEGSSAALMAAAIVQATEGEGALADAAHGEVASPPSCLDLREQREHYDVTTPSRMWCAFNVLTHQRTPQEVLALFTPLWQRAAQQGLSEFAARAGRAGSAGAAGIAAEQVRVWTYSEVKALARAKGQGAALEQRETSVVAGPNPLSASLSLCSAAATRRYQRPSSRGGLWRHDVPACSLG